MSETEIPDIHTVGKRILELSDDLKFVTILKEIAKCDLSTPAKVVLTASLTGFLFTKGEIHKED